jgi:hypothetical protein
MDSQAAASFPIWSYLIGALAAFFASSIDLTVRFPGSPMWRVAYGRYWLPITLLDSAFACIAVGICSTLHLAGHVPWLATWYGWIAIGVSATLIVRANLTTKVYTRYSLPIGFGFVYGSFRSVFERKLHDEYWDATYSESMGRDQWILEKVDALGGTLTVNATIRAVRNYVALVVTPAKGPSTMLELDREIDAALSNNDDIDRIKQLVTMMSEKGYLSPLYNLLGRPSRKERRSWRDGTS